MTVKKAKILLGEGIKHLTDGQIEELILNSSALIEVVLDMFTDQNQHGRKQVLDCN
ncbi:hypothetical protein ACFLZP_03965 [Patescibacteria group bacterium]